MNNLVNKLENLDRMKKFPQPPSGLIIAELRKTLDLHLLVYCKEYNSGTTKEKKFRRQDVGRGRREVFMPPCLSPSTHTCSYQKLSESCCSEVFTTQPISSPSSFPRSWDDEAENSHPLVDQVTSPPPEAVLGSILNHLVQVVST